MQPTEAEMTDNPDATKVKASALSWCSKIEAAKRAAKGSWGDARLAYKELLCGRGERVEGESVSDEDTRYPIYWSSTKSIQPMLYSKTPVPVAEKNLDDLPDNIARLACLCSERLGKNLLRSTPFDRVMIMTRDTFIHAGKTAPRVYCESKFIEVPSKTYYQQQQVMDPQTQQPIAIWIDQNGQPLTQDTELIQDETGFYVEGALEKLEKVSVKLGAIHYRDVVHNPDARCHEEIDWIAYGGDFSKAEVRDKFGGAWIDKLSFATDGNSEDKGSSGEKLLRTPKIRIWEIWDKVEEQVYWHAEGYNDELLVPDGYDGDPYELIGFFPSPAFMLGTTGPDSMFPVPDYIQLKPFIDQLHGLYRRLRRLVRATRRRGLFDNQVAELQALSDSLDEAEWIGVENFKEMIGDGGLEAIVKTFPVNELTDAIREVVSVSEQLEAKLNEIYGIPDIMRGVSDPNETAAAQQQKGKYLSLRASTPMGEFQRLCRDTIELMIDLALKKYPEQQLMKICGVPHWEPEDQQAWPQVLALLQDDEERPIRINIETDSTITMNENAETEQRNYLASTISQAISSIGQVSQFAPEMKPVVMKTMLLLIRGVRAGKEVEDELEKAIEQAMQPQPPGPDPEAAKIQAQQADTQAKMQMQQTELQWKGQELQANMQMKMAQLEVEKQKIAAQSGIDTYKAQSDAMMNAFAQKLKATEIQNEQYKTKLIEMEKWMTELRLQREQQRQENEHSLKAQAMAPAQIQISHGPPAANKRRATMTRDDGSSVQVDVQDQHDDPTNPQQATNSGGQSSKAQGQKIHISHGPPAANKRVAIMTRPDGSSVKIEVQDLHDNLTHVPTQEK